MASSNKDWDVVAVAEGITYFGQKFRTKTEVNVLARTTIKKELKDYCKSNYVTFLTET